MTVKYVLYRAFQFALKQGEKIIKFPEPKLIEGAGSVIKLAEYVKNSAVDSVLIVTGKTVSKMDSFNAMLESLEKLNIKFTVFKDTASNPTINNVEDAVEVYRNNSCGGIIAFGGGSPIDCAKAAAARVSNPDKTIRQLRGYFKLTKKLPPLFAVPTTSGSGSECTVAAVITDEKTHEKFAISDSKLIPTVAVIDPDLTVGLPAKITAETGMDALTHAVEAYIGRSGTSYTDEKAEKASKLILENLETAYSDGKNLTARYNMAIASYYAGLAFTRAFVGYVHAIAHALGGLYGIPHGLANAIILPYVLEYYGESARPKLAKLSAAAKLGDKNTPEKELSELFIDRIRTMNNNMGVPSEIGCIKSEDIPLIVERVLKEANPYYPVPKIMNRNDCKEILLKISVGDIQSQ